MKGFLIDTSVIISLLKDELGKEYEDFVLSKNSSISIITFLETARFYRLAGLKNKWPEAKKELEKFEILQLTQSIAENAAAYAGKLSIADSIIYATAYEHKLTVVTKDKDFKGLQDAVVLK